jgi:small subunit ribosomal protein S18
MARNNDRDRDRNTGSKRAPKDDKRRPAKKRAPLVAEGTYIDYKDIALLRKFTSERGKIRARRVTGLSVQMQADIALAVKTARELALLPYAAKNINERGPRRMRGPREDRGERGERGEAGAENQTDDADTDADGDDGAEG